MNTGRRNAAAGTVLALVGWWAGCSRLAAPWQGHAKTTGTIRALVVTGANLERERFFAVFQQYADVAYREAGLRGGDKAFADASEWDCNVIVWADAGELPSAAQRANVERLLKKGAGLVVLNDGVAAFSDWPAYRQAVGAVCAGGQRGSRGASHMGAAGEGEEVVIHIVDGQQPITRGMNDFFLAAAPGGVCVPGKGSQVLLAAGEGVAARPVGWVRSGPGGTRVCCLQLGAEGRVYENGCFRWLLQEAIRWAAGALVD